MDSKHYFTILENSMGHVFSNKNLLEQALRHSSYGNVNARARLGSNERLEFLGDRILGLVMAEYLFHKLPSAKEGILAGSIAYLNSTKVLAMIADDLNISKFIKTNGLNVKNLETVCADAIEAILGAVYLDAGLDVSRNVIIKLWYPYIKNALDKDTISMFNPKSILQEWTQSINLPLPLYTEVKRTGEDHDPAFTISVIVQGYPPVVTTAASKKLAQKHAAYKFIKDNNVPIR